MRSALRLIFAAALSALGVCATWFWYQSTAPVLSNDFDAKPIAFVERSSEQNSRKLQSKQVWQTVLPGDPLFPGEAVQTSTAGTARIQFADEDRVLELEPDSLIVLNATENNLSLELMEGAVQVSEETPKNVDDGVVSKKIFVKTDKGPLDITNASAELTKSHNALEVEIKKGSAEIGGQELLEGRKASLNGADLSIAQKDDLQILAPSLKQPTIVSNASRNPISFAWKGFPAVARVELLLGANRKELEPKADVQPGTSQALLPLPPGNYYWKLVAHDPRTGRQIQESSIFQLSVQLQAAPTLTSPANRGVLTRIGSELKVDFQWQAPDQSVATKFELSRDATLKDLIQNKNLLREGQWTQGLPDGDYYWRVSTRFDNSENWMASPVQTFRVTSVENTKPLSVYWQSPVDSAKILFAEQPAVDFAWALSATGPGKDSVKSWRIRIGATPDDLLGPKAQIIETTSNRLHAPVRGAGRYVASVEALTINKKVVATSDLRSFEVATIPLLGAPSILPLEGEIQVDPQGQVHLTWSQPEGARSYRVQVFSEKGALLKEVKVDAASLVFNGFKPGDYAAKVAAIDERGRMGSLSNLKYFTVPEEKKLAAPKLKTIKVSQ